jgi:hypothetical protein
MIEQDRVIGRLQSTADFLVKRIRRLERHLWGACLLSGALGAALVQVFGALV